MGKFKKKTPNRDLWEKLLALMEYHLVTFEWIKAMRGTPKMKNVTIWPLKQ